MSSYKLSSYKLSMPAGTHYLHLTLALSTFSYAILFSSLTLYLINLLGFPPSRTNGIVALFFAFNSVLHLFGGYIGSRLLSYRNLLAISLSFGIIGLYILSKSQPQYFYLGLSFFLISCGFNSTCINCLLTQKFKPDDSRLETAFFINYSFLNLGFFLGFIASGYFDLHTNYKDLFQLASLVNLTALVLLGIGWRYFNTTGEKNITTNQKRKCLFGIISIIFFMLAMLLGFQYESIANYLVLICGLITLIAIVFFAILTKNVDVRHKIYAFVILSTASIIFWMLLFVGPMGVIYFLKNNTNSVILTYKISPQWFLNLNSIFVIFGTPVVAIILNKLRAVGVKISIPQQFSFALFLITLSFYVLSLGIHYSNALGITAGEWIVLHYLLQSLGEILIGPVGSAMVGKLAPKKLQGIMMGFWMMVTGMAATLSHYFSNLMTQTDSINPVLSNPNYLDVFNQMGLYGLVAALFLFVIANYLQKLITADSQDNIAPSITGNAVVA